MDFPQRQFRGKTGKISTIDAPAGHHGDPALRHRHKPLQPEFSGFGTSRREHPLYAETLAKRHGLKHIRHQINRAVQGDIKAFSLCHHFRQRCRVKPAIGQGGPDDNTGKPRVAHSVDLGAHGALFGSRPDEITGAGPDHRHGWHAAFGGKRDQARRRGESAEAKGCTKLDPVGTAYAGGLYACGIVNADFKDDPRHVPSVPAP